MWRALRAMLDKAQAGDVKAAQLVFDRLAPMPKNDAETEPSAQERTTEVLNVLDLMRADLYGRARGRT